MKKLILTIAIGRDYTHIAKFTHPSLVAYAKKTKADFKIIDKQDISQTTPHWEKFQISALLNEYDRILYLDTDLIIRDDCPDLFELVPEDSLGMFNEAPFTNRSRELMIDICRSYDVTLSEWNGKYYNSGVMVISKRYQFLFEKPEKEVFNFYEQSYLNMMIAKHQIKMYELHYDFNRMTCIDRFVGIDRHASYIVHYAGYPNLVVAIDLIQNDLEHWKKRNGNYQYKHNIYISVSGGLGDQIEAEPAIRFMRRNLYPNDEFVVATHFPRIFQHLSKEGVIVCEQGKARLKNDSAYFITQSLPDPTTYQWSMISHLLCHSVDYTSIALIKRTLPLKDKEIQLEVTPDDFDRLFRVLNFRKLEKLIVVHPGRHWMTKTFPVEYWQAIIDGLIKAKKKVVIIGKDEPGDPPDFKAGARGTVDVICRGGMYDLRNKLDLGSLMALLSKAKVLVSNDSAPIHIAGAFDNWIVLLPSCKNPDYILPWRKGRLDYKSMTLYKKLIIDEVESRPTCVYPTSADFVISDWQPYLLEADKVVKNILSIK